MYSMGKKVLAIYFSQSGQLGEIIDNFCLPLAEAGVSVEKVRVHLQNDFAFPWTTKSFFSVMPDCVLGVQHQLAPFTLNETAYDLIVLGYQAWFLSPSIPFNALIHHPLLRQVIKNTPVITITGARNMWVNAYEKIKKLLWAADAKLVGNIALTDTHLNLVSIFTIFHWMLTGKKDRYMGFFPLPGVPAADIAHTETLGRHALPYLQKNDWTGFQDVMVGEKGVDLKWHLIFIESKAGVMFKLWANLISKSKKREAWLVVFKYYLLIALFIAAPIVFLIDRVVFRPFLPKYVKAKKAFYLKLN